MSIIKEFKEFAMKGNLVDMAVGVVMGGAFGKVVSGFIDGMVMPLIGKLLGGVDFNNLYFPLSDKIVAGSTLEDAKKLGPVIAWGSFVTLLVDFVIVAAVIFMVVKAMNKMKKAEPAPEPAGPSSTDVLLTEIRDALKK
jgi:large conductance mechanosensitive channel